MKPFPVVKVREFSKREYLLSGGRFPSGWKPVRYLYALAAWEIVPAWYWPIGATYEALRSAWLIVTGLRIVRTR